MCNKFVASILVVGAMTISSTILAQAPVEDRSVSAPSRTTNSGSSNTNLTENASTQLYLELQTLRQEITELRGLIEELGYQVDQLRSRQSNDYANLDRRILELMQGGSSATGAATTSSTSANTTANTNMPVANAGQSAQRAAELYNQAFASLRGGDREAAIRQFEALVNEYPTDPVAGDALYWMGETHWVGAAYEQARQVFVTLVERFPEHRRFGDALYKLGLIYHQLGDNTAATGYLQQAVSLGGDVGARADEFLTQSLSP